MVLQVSERKKLSAMVLDEPLSPETELKRRNLLFTSCFSILLAVYGLKVTKTPWLDFEIPQGAPNILHGALSVALVYTFVVFALHALTDLRRWFMAGDLMHLNSYFDLTLNSSNHLHFVSQWLGKPLPDQIEQRKSVEKMYSDANSFFSELESVIATAKSSHSKLAAIQWFRLVLVDLGIPLSLGIFAMLKIGSALPPFLAVVFG